MAEDAAPEPGRVHQRWIAVTAAHLASALATEPGEAYPGLLSTPAMVAEMERACAALLCPLLRAGEVSVGARIEELVHLAPTLPGETVATTATYEGREGALHWFRVEAADSGGVIGRARHARAILGEVALLARAGARSTARLTALRRSGLAGP